MIRTASALGALTLALGLTGCTDAGGTTCEEFNGQSLGEQTDTLHSLLGEHDLETADIGNIQGVNEAVAGLCADNPSAQLDDATDWDSDTW